MKTRPSLLVLSFTTLIRALRDREVTDEQLEKAVFYLGCSERHAVDPWSGPPSSNELLWFFENDLDAAKAVHGRILFALLTAERDGRITYRETMGKNTFAQLDGLLVKNGLKALAFDGDDIDDGPWYRENTWNRPMAAIAATKANPGLTVIGD